MKRLNLIFLGILLIILGYVCFFHFNKMNNTIKEFEGTLEKKEQTVDSLIQRLNYLHEAIDSLPLGSPLDTININNGYGVRRHPIHGRWQMHSGIDLVDSWHDTIYATGSGVVNIAKWNFGYGRYIQINHSLGFKSTYAHLYRSFVVRGDKIIKGQPIGRMGSSGTVTGQHLHYEISHYGKNIDPLPYINCSPIEVTATMYHPVEEQCDDTPLNTADGSKIDPYKVSNWNWIAVSQDLLWFNGGPFRYGDSVYVCGTPGKDGVYFIHDAMNKRMKSKIDFLENIGTKPYKYKNIELYVLK